MKLIGVGSNSILGGPNVIYTAIAAICAPCMNINKVSRVMNIGGGGGAGSPAPPVPTPMKLAVKDRLCPLSPVKVVTLSIDNIYP